MKKKCKTSEDAAILEDWLRQLATSPVNPVPSNFSQFQAFNYFGFFHCRLFGWWNKQFCVCYSHFSASLNPNWYAKGTVGNDVSELAASVKEIKLRSYCIPSRYIDLAATNTFTVNLTFFPHHHFHNIDHSSSLTRVRAPKSHKWHDH